MAASNTSPLVAALSDIGLRRKENQDSYGHFRGEGPAAAKGHLVVVADGMGGHQGGGVASRLAVDTIVGVYRDAPAGSPTDILHQAFEQASHRIFETAQQRPDLASMGTTCTALVFADNRVHVVHVGDTRAYLIRDAKIQRLTADQTWVQAMAAQGVITSHEAEQHPEQHEILCILYAAPLVADHLHETERLWLEANHHAAVGGRAQVCVLPRSRQQRHHFRGQKEGQPALLC